MNRFTATKAELQKMLGPDVGIGVSDPKSPGGALLPEEEPALARAVTKRKLEFTSGRVAARRAMRELNLPPDPIPMADDRSPVWPAGIVGSITHCNDICIAVVARSNSRHSIGIDIEANTPLDPALEQIVCVSSERAWLDTQPIERRAYLAKEIFCAKESIYKALYPLTRQIIGFDALEVELPLRQESRVTLRDVNCPQRLAVELRSVAIKNSVFVYTHLSCTPYQTKRTKRMAS